jgi:hypothetical protein
VVIPVSRLTFDSVRVEILQWQENHGSLSEIQVWRGGRNVAEGAKVTASAQFDANYAAAKLTDGIATSAVASKGYWLLPVGQPGWAEVELPASPATAVTDGADVGGAGGR